MRRALALALAPAVVLCAPGAARAAEGTEIASALDEGDAFDLYIGIDYAFEAKKAAIKREFSDPSLGTPDAPLPIVKDLIFTQRRHIITPHLQLGIFNDLQLSVALPVVINDTREWGFDQRADPCIFDSDPQMRDPTCIDRDNSTTLADGLLPVEGYDAYDRSTNFALDSTTIFRGIDRWGLDQVHLGLAWAPMNQEKDDTKPTWVIGAEVRLSVGQIMRFDRDDPASEDGVSRGVHEFRAYTALSKRTTWAEPFVQFWWQAPFALRGTDPEDDQGSLFWDVGFGQENIWPQQQAGVIFGFEAIPWEDKRQKQKLSIEFRGRIEARFEGRDYSEMWEPFAYAGDVANNPSGPLVLDRDPTSSTDLPLSHPGVTDIENYLKGGGRVGIRGWMGDNAKFSASFEYVRDQRHRISWTDAGEELPACSAGQTTGCETPNDDVITPGTREVNPLHRQVIDVVGRRYLVDEVDTFTFWVSGTIMF